MYNCQSNTSPNISPRISGRCCCLVSGTKNYHPGNKGDTLVHVPSKDSVHSQRNDAFILVLLTSLEVRIQHQNIQT